MQSLRDRYLGNVSGGEAQSKTSGYRNEEERQVRYIHSQMLEKTEPYKHTFFCGFTRDGEQ